MPEFKRVRFVTIPSPGAEPLLSFDEPPSVGVLEAAPELSFENENPPQEAALDFECALFKVDGELNDKALAAARYWVSNRKRGDLRLFHFRARFDDGSVVEIMGARVLLVNVPDPRAILAVIAEFILLENSLRNLERELDGQWEQAKKDLHLASDVHSKDLERMDEVAATTRAVWLRRIRLARLEAPLARSQNAIGKPARKLAVRLRRRGNIASRLEILDGQIECFEYIYEMTNQRMGEYKNFRREFVVEILIAVLLAMEVTFMAWDFIRHYHDH